MAILFDATTEYMDHGSAASVDDLDTWTMLFWAFPNSVSAGNRLIIDKGEIFIFIGSATGTGRIVARRDRVTDFASSRSVDDVLTVSTWQFIAVTFDLGGATNEIINILLGDANTPCAEVSYDIQDDGAGALVTDAASVLRVGSSGAPSTTADSRVASFSMWNKVLTPAECVQQQFSPRPTSGCIVFSNYFAAANAIDHSGSGNDGTLTGSPTLAASHAPYQIYPARRRRRPVVAAVGGATGQLLQLPHHLRGGADRLHGGFAA